MPETRALLRYLRMSPTKVRQVLGLIRGRDVEDARAELDLCTRGPVYAVRKLLDSAVANAEHNDNVPEDELFVSHAYADEGPTLKRWRPRARGRGTRIRKRTSHVTIVVSRFSDEELARRRRRDADRPPRKRRMPRRRPAARHEEHEELEELEAGEEALETEAGEEALEIEADEGGEPEPARRSRAQKAPSGKGTAEKTTGQKATAKTVKKTTAKKTPAKKTIKRTRKRD